jgi:hypothetical protein
MTSYPVDRCSKWALVVVDVVVVVAVVVVVSWMYNSLYLCKPMNSVHYNIEQKYFAFCHKT